MAEYSKPGSMLLHFYRDAYFEKGERRPDADLYYVCSEPVPYGEELGRLAGTYREENASQLKTQSGDYILVIGEYDSREEAEETLLRLQRDYEGAPGLSVGSCKAGERP